MSKCILLGAGASYGYDESLSEDSKPPITNKLFYSGYKTSIFPHDYNRILCSLEEFCNKKISLESSNDIDVEKFMEWVHEKWEKLKVIEPHDHAQVNHYAGTLGEMWYFLYEIIRHYSIAYKPNNDSYYKLAVHYSKNPYTVITLNYDTIFELAITATGKSYDYCTQNELRNIKDKIPIAKVHGSINWISNFSHMVGIQGLRQDQILENIAPIIHSNRVYRDTIDVIDAGKLSNYSRNELLPSGTDYYEPLILPPLGSNKDYAKSKVYGKVWCIAEQMIREASELVIVGTQLRPEDVKLCAAIQINLKKDCKITIVSHTPEKIQKSLEDILQRDGLLLEKPFKSFTKYIDSLA